MRFGNAKRVAAVATALLITAGAARAADTGKAACIADAKRLCPAEMKALSRSRVRACLIAHIEQTGPACHAYMIAARDAVLRDHKPDPSAQ